MTRESDRVPDDVAAKVAAFAQGAIDALDRAAAAKAADTRVLYNDDTEERLDAAAAEQYASKVITYGPTDAEVEAKAKLESTSPEDPELQEVAAQAEPGDLWAGGAATRPITLADVSPEPNRWPTADELLHWIRGVPDSNAQAILHQLLDAHARRFNLVVTADIARAREPEDTTPDTVPVELAAELADQYGEPRPGWRWRVSSASLVAHVFSDDGPLCRTTDPGPWQDASVQDRCWICLSEVAR